MAREYISWLGLFTQSKKGISILISANIFTYLERLADETYLADNLCVLLANTMNYNMGEETQKLLRAWSTKGSKELIMYIIEHLSSLYRDDPKNFSFWCIDILTTLIYSKEKEIILKSLSVIEEVCENEEYMHCILNKWPKFDKLILGGDSFLAKFLWTEAGIKFFEEHKWIDKAIQRWVDTENNNYAELADEYIQNELNKNTLTSEDSNLQLYIPPDCPLDIHDNVFFTNK